VAARPLAPSGDKEKGAARCRPLVTRKPARSSIRDVERGARFADRQVGLVPFFLGWAVGIVFQRGFVDELHYKDVGLFRAFGNALGILDLDGLDPNARDAFVLRRQRPDAGERGLDLLRRGAGFPRNRDHVDDGFGRRLRRDGYRAQRQQAGDHEGH